MKSRYQRMTSCAAASSGHSVGPTTTVSAGWKQEERRHHAEVAASAADRPEQVALAVGARRNEAAVGKHHVGSYQIVNRRPQWPCKVADAAAQCQAAHASRRNKATRRRKAKRVRGMIHIAPCAAPSTLTVFAAGSTRMPRMRERSITKPSSQPPSAAVCRRRDREELMSASEAHAGNHIGHVGAAHNQPGSFVDHAVVDRARCVVARILRFDQLAAQLRPRSSIAD